MLETKEIDKKEKKKEPEKKPSDAIRRNRRKGAQEVLVGFVSVKACKPDPTIFQTESHAKGRVNSYPVSLIECSWSAVKIRQDADLPDKLVSHERADEKKTSIKTQS